MSVIGNFVPAKDGGWTGTVRTLTINAKLRFEPNDNRENRGAPTFLIFVGRSRVGEAWAARSKAESPRDYLRVRLDDPSLSTPMNAALFHSDAGGEAQLVWNRKYSGEEPTS